MENHFCKICVRSFPSGRSLGGHMRSHVAMNSSFNCVEKPTSGYGLRENPRKSWRFDEACPKLEKEKLCTRTHCSELEVGKEQADSWSTGLEDEEEGETEIQNESQVRRRRRQKRRSKRVEMISVSSPPSPAPSAVEYGALCLMMLSRNLSSVSDSELYKIGQRKPEFFPTESSVSLDGIDGESKKDVTFTIVESGKRKKSNGSDFDTESECFSKRSKYECTICTKSFHTYQALGGHCASHKRNKAETSLVFRAAGDFISDKLRAHQCPICGKIFTSGQALGGHKRSHLITESIEIQQKNPLDLNLPIPEFRFRDSFNSSGRSDEIKFTDFEKSCRLQQAFMI